MDTTQIDANRLQKRAARLSLILGIGILALKALAYQVTGSAALLSDALESIINVVASAFALWSIHLAQTPPDANHPYGHGKIEYFSALTEGVLIFLAAGAITWGAFPKIFAPVPLQQLDIGLSVSVLASAINLLLGLYLIRTGKSTRSITLEADGKHILTDVFTTAGVLGGLAVVWATGWLWLDGAIACAVAVNILFTGYGLIRQAAKGLMDESDAALMDGMEKLLEENRDPSWISIHNLRAWQGGRRVHIDMHLVLPRDTDFAQIRQQIEAVERIFAEKFSSSVEVLVNVDMCDDDACPKCSIPGCDQRVSGTKPAAPGNLVQARRNG